jgi:hypothetical protein
MSVSDFQGVAHFTKYPFFGSRQIDCSLPASGKHGCRASSRQAIDGKNGLGGYLQTTQNQPAAPPASGLPVLAEKDGDRAHEPSLVYLYHLRAGAERVLVSRGDHGLGHTQGPKLAVE